MKLFIAEKPSLGKSIAQYLPGPHKAGSGFMECDGGRQKVTWCFGHVFEQEPPDYYTPDSVPRTPKGRKKWRWEDLPILPDQWKIHPKPDAKAQIQVIRGLLKQADSVVNAGDPDREGQLLVDEVLEELGWKGSTQRIWLAALDEQSVKKALANLKDNADYKNLKDSALARSRADWLMGMNLTRAFSLANKGSGVLSVGRVQTPTLRLVADRDNAIENFKPKDFFVPRIQTEKTGVLFWSSWLQRDVDGVDAEGYLVSKKVADALADRAKQDGVAIVADYESAEKKQAAPLGFSLSELQKVCSAKLGLSAQEVLDVAQELYETYKCATYPRTDCRYLPEEQHSQAGQVLGGLAELGFSNAVQNADPSQKSGIWNTAKVTAHHAIIPTGAMTGTVSGVAKKVFILIVGRYLAQFYPPYIYRATKITLDAASEKWVAKGKVPVSWGWKVLEGKKDDEEDAESDSPVDLPVLKKGDVLTITAVDVQSKQTKPPARFTDGSLIEAMSNIHKFVEDPAAKAKLKETSGIGTEATRASIIETLLKREFIVRKGKQIISTPSGRALATALPDVLTNPVTTARWEDALGAIAEGKITADVFEQKQRDFVTKLVGVAKGFHIQVGEARAAGGGKPRKAGPKCGACGKPTIFLKTKTGKDWLKCESCGAAFWPAKGGKSCGTQWEKRAS
ncbi:DNA topoisomerase III [Acidithiobacillus thiooxidans]|uniref:DNA topoisomerase III n=1 Tax=Acidithiobacillus thiooxidans TaxID=930 RepID=UPI001C066031|nr:DNA topoisomerase III [Acidithiobacillus thiooxidans]MBU2834209.1 DNA topoisomerase III [Acidithiobacillus thiooxidans]